MVKRFEFFKTVKAKFTDIFCIFHSSDFERTSKFHKAESFFFFANKKWNRFWNNFINHTCVNSPRKTLFSPMNFRSFEKFSSNFICKPIQKSLICICDCKTTGIKSSFSIRSWWRDFDGKTSFSINNSCKIRKFGFGQVHGIECTINKLKCLA